MNISYLTLQEIDKYWNKNKTSNQLQDRELCAIWQPPKNPTQASILSKTNKKKQCAKTTCFQDALNAETWYVSWMETKTFQSSTCFATLVVSKLITPNHLDPVQ